MPTLTSETTIQRFRWLFAELLVIVLGILIAFQVDEWQSERDNRNSERDSLYAIYQDLELEHRELSEFTDIIEYNRQIWLRMMALLRDRTDLTEQGILSTLSRYNVRPVEPTNSAFTSLIESGRLNLISDEEIQLELIDFYQVKIPRIHFSIDSHLQSIDEYISILLTDINFIIDQNYEATQDYTLELLVLPDNFPSHPSLQRVLVDLDYSAISLTRRIGETISQIEELQSDIRPYIGSENEI